jgi:vacuolar-type H+-ATPase subunit E/Vma4
VLSAAGRKAKMIRLSSEESLSARLFRLAESCLPLLRETGYEDVFRRLSLELPPLEWQTVKVHPGDLALTGRFFPGAEIVPDKSISGGMVAEAEESGIRVVNTFEKRLERAWAEMLPKLLEDVKQEVMGDISSRGN